MSKATSYTAGLLSGAILGGAFALLYAPGKGSKTRRIISYRLRNYMDEIRRLLDELSEEANISDARKKSDLVVEDARKRAEDLIEEAEEMLGEVEKPHS